VELGCKTQKVRSIREPQLSRNFGKGNGEIIRCSISYAENELKGEKRSKRISSCIERREKEQHEEKKKGSSGSEHFP